MRISFFECCKNATSHFLFEAVNSIEKVYVMADVNFFYFAKHKNQIITLLPLMLYISGSQPGVRAPPGVREKSRGLRQIFIILILIMKKSKVAPKT